MRSFFRGLLCYGVWICGLALASSHLCSWAQTLPSPTDMRGGQSGLESLLGARKPSLPAGDVFFEGPINPDEYFVGPGDRLNIVFWQPTFNENEIVVNGEGEIVIPYVGVVQLAGLTLTQSRKAIDEAVSRAMRIGRVTVSLVQPRQFRVHVTGQVNSPGTYVVTATARVADAIDMAAGLRREITLSGTDTLGVIRASQRRIELLDRDGRLTGYADMMMFRSGGKSEANPYLRDGQIIHVPYPAEDGLEIGISGSVFRSGLYEYAEGDCLCDAIALGGGLTPFADSTSILVVSGQGERVTADLRTAQAEMLLEAGDRVYVNGRPDTSRSGSVVISGEVARPGGYPIIVGQTTVRQLLEMAGGMLPDAAASSARLVRESSEQSVGVERDRLLAEAQKSRSKPVFLADPGLAAEFMRFNYGTVVLDLNPASRNGEERAEVFLRDGDVLEIPRTPLGVRVLGYVNRAGEVPWDAGKGLNHYLTLAGGTNNGGWKRQTVVVKARNGAQVRYDSKLTIDPGDVIYVPPKEPVTTIKTIQDFLAITAGVITIALVVQSTR